MTQTGVAMTEEEIAARVKEVADKLLSRVELQDHDDIMDASMYAMALNIKVSIPRTFFRIEGV